jgi:hypothetical protein
VLKICLSPYIVIKITDELRKQDLLKLTQAIRAKYENRHNKKEYNCYLSKIVATGAEEGQSSSSNLISWFVEMLEQVPLGTPTRERAGTPGLSSGVDLRYSLYDHPVSSKANPAHPKLLLAVLRSI